MTVRARRAFGAARTSLIAAFCAVALFAVTACETTVSTRIEVTGPGEIDISVVVTATEGAAKAFNDSSELRDRVTSMLSEHGATVEFHSDDDEVRWEATGVDPNTIIDSAPITGVAGISVAEGDPTAVINVNIVAPTQLREALEATDDESAVPVLLTQTRVEVSVHGSGAERIAGLVTTPAEHLLVTEDDDVVTVSRPVSSDATGGVAVRAAPLPDRSPLPWIIAAAATVAAAGTVWRRRHTADTPPQA